MPGLSQEQFMAISMRLKALNWDTAQLPPEASGILAMRETSKERGLFSGWCGEGTPQKTCFRVCGAGRNGGGCGGGVQAGAHPSSRRIYKSWRARWRGS